MAPNITRGSDFQGLSGYLVIYEKKKAFARTAGRIAVAFVHGDIVLAQLVHRHGT